jgi:prepilin-type N-terminal cleavage/methylation domain-containing protein
MPTTTPSPRRPERPGGRRGFTLTELIVATSLSGILLVAVLSSVLLISRSGYLLNNYVQMEHEARHALEAFAVDARVTQDVVWHRASASSPLTGITLVAPDGTSVRYTYDAANGTLTRNAASGSKVLVSGIQSLTFTAYRYDDAAGLQAIPPASSTDAQINGLTKMLQISLSSVRTRVTLADSTNNVVSARYVLRNKIQTV